MSSETRGAGNFQELLQVAQRVQSEIERVQGELAAKTVEGSAGGGMVVAVANGRQQLLSVRIEREVVDPADVHMLEDLVVAAVNQALSKAAEVAKEEMAKVAGAANLGLPGMF
jgi:nucleoid-associated protein EbfC